jgi:predicted O-linked N-acetylglucosamine transferase (SPINDLY family)
MNKDNINNLNYENAKYFFEIGLDEYELGNYFKAEQNFRKSLEFVNDRLSTITNLIATLLKLGKNEEAKKFINIGLEIDINDSVLLLNKGIYNLKENNLHSALSSFQDALKNNPEYYEAHYNVGSIFMLLNNINGAITSYNNALDINPNYVDALYNRANVFLKLGKYQNAIKDFDNAMSVDPQYPDLLASYTGAKMQLCDWENYNTNKESLKDGVLVNNVICSPFRLLSLFDSPELHLHAACSFANSEMPFDNSLGKIGFPLKNNKIKIGYFSADFHNHATSYLMAEIFELHDNKNFEIYAFSFGPNYNDEMRERIIKACHKFIDVANKSDYEIALLSRDLKINIAIDLKGFTGGQRCGIFAKRCAPIQINYLGYPGTLGSDVYDYIIADKIIIPTDQQINYIEKIIYLPNCYQPNDSKRIISNIKTTKSDHNIPLDSFVFCSFNNTYKILPEIFIVWLKILKAKSNSVLWLIDDNFTAVNNLKRFASDYGISPERVIFAKRTDLPTHLERHIHADLFLDTFPYNAHTTASDSLWAGLPVLTCSGQSFASRVSASLLTSCGLPNFITNSFIDFEYKAIEFSNNPKIINQAKYFLKNNNTKSALFNSKLYTLNLEKAYLVVYENYLNKLKPDHLYIE